MPDMPVENESAAAGTPRIPSVPDLQSGRDPEPQSSHMLLIRGDFGNGSGLRVILDNPLRHIAEGLREVVDSFTEEHRDARPGIAGFQGEPQRWISVTELKSALRDTSLKLRHEASEYDDGLSSVPAYREMAGTVLTWTRQAYGLVSRFSDGGRMSSESFHAISGELDTLSAALLQVAEKAGMLGSQVEEAILQSLGEQADDTGEAA